ncbi:hypothetical protein FA95DRAFT_579393 [Auriscalpium vulgare]|uniref:Uncharacterized protein n=1 Tax=Auriscalpium vulgare TaxID=40419 RepID=A0ACB8S2L9_9AGAM|nr:hypothetical protein FA95DRAFT_579393 [Auriscalpium vulgare]
MERNERVTFVSRSRIPPCWGGQLKRSLRRQELCAGLQLLTSVGCTLRMRRMSLDPTLAETRRCPSLRHAAQLVHIYIWACFRLDGSIGRFAYIRRPSAHLHQPVGIRIRIVAAQVAIELR